MACLEAWRLGAQAFDFGFCRFPLFLPFPPFPPLFFSSCATTGLGSQRLGWDGLDLFMGGLFLEGRLRAWHCETFVLWRTGDNYLGLYIVFIAWCGSCRRQTLPSSP